MDKPTCAECHHAVYRYWRSFRPSPLVLLNIYLFGWESDAIYVTDHGYVYEYEIKVSLADFRSDFKNKTGKHRCLSGNENGPALFSFVCPDGLIPKEEVPDGYGLYYVDRYLDQWTLFEIVRPKRRNVSKLTWKQWRELAIKATVRFWNGHQPQEPTNDKP